VNDNDGVVRYSTNFGSTWSASINVTQSIGAGSHSQGVNVQTAANGDVYIAFAIYDAWPGGEDAIGLAKSTDGGVTWSTSRIYSALNFGIRGTLSSKNGIRVSSFPSMAIDRSGGAYDGAIYICFPQINVAPAGSDPDIVLISSFDGGTTWTAPVRVNDDPLNNGKDQYYPWVTVDQSNGRVSLVWYDSRDVPNNQAEVFMGQSTDGAATFENFKVSSQPHTPSPISGLAGGYAGDYIGVAALNDVAYPFWAENSTGNYQAWTARVEYGPPCPVDPPSNPNPGNGAIDVSITLANLSWDNGAGATQMELWFGEAGSMSMVYTGGLITTWSIPGNLNYFTDYNWRVVGKNDTCSVNGPVWVFKTEQDPNFVQDTIKVYPQSVARWTGTTNGSTITDDSEVRGLDTEDGWFMFDISPINDEATVTQITFFGYVNSTNWPYWSATPLPGLYPLTASALELKNAIEANSGQGVAYIYENESSSFATGWHDYPMENGAIADFEASLAQDWFAMGMDSRDNSSTYYIEWDGWNEANIPYLEVMYNFIVPVELTSFTAQASDENVQLNWSTATETNNQGFDIERKAGTSNFEKIGYVAGFGTTTEPKSYSFTDANVNVGEYTYRLKQIDFDGTYEYSDEVNIDVNAPIEYALEQNYPNPFNPSTTIKYSIPEDGSVKLAVYNMLGEQVVSLIETNQKAGRYEISFNAENLASGVYIYRLEASNYTASKKLMLMK
jgi:hypothetical protein